MTRKLNIYWHITKAYESRYNVDIYAAIVKNEGTGSIITCRPTPDLSILVTRPTYRVVQCLKNSTVSKATVSKLDAT